MNTDLWFVGKMHLTGSGSYVVTVPKPIAKILGSDEYKFTINEVDKDVS